MPMFGIYNPYNPANIGKVAPTRVLCSPDLETVRSFFAKAEQELRNRGLGHLADKFNTELNMTGVVLFNETNSDHAEWVITAFATGKLVDLNKPVEAKNVFDKGVENLSVVDNEAKEGSDTPTKVDITTTPIFFVYTTEVKNGPSFAFKAPSVEYVNINLRQIIPNTLIEAVETDKTRQVDIDNVRDMLMLQVLNSAKCCFDMTRKADGTSRLN